MGSPRLSFFDPKQVHAAVVRNEQAEAPLLHDPELLRSRDLYSRQLGFSFSDNPVVHARHSKPQTAVERRALAVESLRSHVEFHPAFWAEMKLSSLTSQGSSVRHLQAGELVGDKERVIDFLRPLLQNRSLVHLDRNTRTHFTAGLQFLIRQLQGPHFNGTAFRTVWILLWPLIGDFDSQAPETQKIRISMQKIIALSF